jgi:hypothetical protein
VSIGVDHVPTEADDRSAHTRRRSSQRMAGMLLLLAAVDIGLGGWYFGVPYGKTSFRQEFDIPDERNVIGVVGLGYAGDDAQPRGSAYSLSRRPLHEMIHRNHWSRRGALDDRARRFTPEQRNETATSPHRSALRCRCN